MSSVVSQESCMSKTSLGSSICLILSFDDQSSGINQVTKQWSPNNNEILEESASGIQADSCQPQDKNSMQMQQPQEMLQERWPNESVKSNDTKPKSSCVNLAQLQIKNQGEPDQSPSKEEISSLLSTCNIESSFCNHLPENLQSNNNQTYLQLSPDVDQMQISKNQVQKTQSQSYSPNWMQKSAHNNLETNQNQSDDHLRAEVAAEVTHRVSMTSNSVLTSDTFQAELKAHTQTRHACAYYSLGSVHPVPCGKTMTSWLSFHGVALKCLLVVCIVIIRCEACTSYRIY